MQQGGLKLEVFGGRHAIASLRKLNRERGGERLGDQDASREPVRIGQAAVSVEAKQNDRWQDSHSLNCGQPLLLTNGSLYGRRRGGRDAEHDHPYYGEPGEG